MEVALTPGSPLHLSRLLEYRGVVFWDQVDFPDVPFTAGDRYIQLDENQARRIDLVAHDAYGDSELMWVLLLVNGKELPNQFVAGEQIRVPARESIEELLAPHT